MSRLIVVSNRVKMPDSQLAGGLAVGLYDALQQHGGIWLGWQGNIADTNDFQPLSPNLAEAKITYVTTPLTQSQYQHFYCGFANNVLWPLLHDRLDLVQETAQDYDIYQQVNALFAQQLQKMAQPDDVIWVHDYHFLSVAYYCRKFGMNNRIGFFIHIPFADLPYWQANAHSQELISHLSHYNVIGTQTLIDHQHCNEVMQHYTADKLDQVHSVTAVDGVSIRQGAQNPRYIQHYPIGVDVAMIQRQVHAAATKTTMPSNNLSPVRRIIAVDRIDYSKGILERLNTFEKFLHAYPQFVGQIQLHQIACPSRLDLPTYQHLHDDVHKKVAQINATFATPTWQPIDYDETVVAHETLMTIFASSELCWVNSLKDGMNLVAKEYIAAQSPHNPGVLLLSRHTGASQQMHDALLIDPYDELDVMDALSLALNMPLSERQHRYDSLVAQLQQQDLYAWQQQFLQDLYAIETNELNNLTENNTQEHKQ